MQNGAKYFFWQGIVNSFVRLHRAMLSGIAGAMKLLVTLIGLVLILEGLPYVASPESMQRWLRQILEMEPAQLRRIGVVAMVMGFVLCFLAQRSALFQ